MKRTIFTLYIFLGTCCITQGQNLLLTNSLMIGKDSSGQKNASQNKNRYTRAVSVFTRVSYEGGYIMPVDDNSSVNDILKASRYSSLSISNTWDVSSTSVYSKIYRKPKLGIGMAFTNFHHASLGKPYLIYGYTEIPINKRENRLNFTYGVGVGLAWNFEHYDKVTNPGNEAIGSSINAHMQASINMNYWLTERFLLGIGTGFRHYSNGAFQKPNAGINIIPVSFSLQYKIRERQIAEQVAELPKFRKQWGFSIYNSVGAKQLEIEEPVVFKNLLGFNAGYSLDYKYRAVAGMDFTYTSGSSERINGEQSNFSKSVSYGPYIGWEWYLTDRIYIPIYFGTYLHRNIENEEESRFFQRIGIRYTFLPSRAMFAGVGLKTHVGSADFMEFNFGINL